MAEIKNVTSLKLEEAKFFLKKMKFEGEFDSLLKGIIGDVIENRRHYSQTVQEFHFNFDAFLCAFRSITSMMQKELAGVDGFKAWYSGVRKRLRDDGEMRLLCTIRNFTLHQSIIPSSIEVSITAHGGKVSNEVVWYIAEDIKENKKVAKIPSIDDILKRDVVTICTDCINKMAGIVSECEQKFFAL